MILVDMLPGIAGRLGGVLQGYEWMIPEIGICMLLILGIFTELFLHGKSEKLASSWRYFMTQIGLALLLVLAYQRYSLHSVGFASFQLFWINEGSNAINLLIILLAFILLIVNQARAKSFHLEEQIGFLSVLAGAVLTGISNHWLSLYLSLELMSLGTYVLVGIRKDQEGARASLPYILFGMGTSAMFLYGVSLIYGLSGTLYLHNPEFSRALSMADPSLVGLALGLVGAGILFKMALAPLHPWSPDVLESLPAAWMSWISTAPKIAAAWLGIRLMHLIPTEMTEVVAMLAILTLLIGHLGALGQKNAKRLLAYSSIAHGGFMAMAWLFPAEEATKALVFYGLTYGLSTVLVFYLVDENEGAYQPDDLATWDGYASRAPWKAGLLLVGLVSLIGLPPAGTFLAKITYFSLLWDSFQLHKSLALMCLLAVAILCTAISIYYYLKIPYRMYLKKASNNEMKGQEKGLESWVFILLACGILLCFLAPNYVFNA
jgi:NADH-quinone oxidoreductase subunit N